MARSPDKTDIAAIVRLADGGTSVRRISKMLLWSRPTVAKVLREAGWSPNRRTDLAYPGRAAGFDFEAKMRELDEELKEWWEGLTAEEREQERAKGPPDDRFDDGGFLGKSY